MCRHRSILQTARDVKPPEPVFMRDERRVAGNPIKAALVSGWSKLWRLVQRKIGVINSGPFLFRAVPPDQFLAVAPRLAGWAGARSIIYDAAIARPGEAPTVANIIFRITRVRLANLIWTEDASVNPAAACGRTVGLQPWITVNLRTVMRIPCAIDAENDPIAAAGVTACGYSGMRICVPSVDLCQHGFHFWIARLVFRIPPIECAQRFIERIARLFRFGDQAQSELMHEPRLGARLARRIDSFLAPLQHALRLCEGAFLFRMP